MVFGVLISLAPALRAQTSLYWDLNANTAGSAAGLGGVWGGTAANWNSSATGAAGTLFTWQGTNHRAVFSAGGDATGTYNVSMTSTLNLEGITVEEGSPFVSGAGTLIFIQQFNTISVADGNTLTLNPTINKFTSGTITKSGGGTLVLGANNGGGSFPLAAGVNFSVTGGTLALANANALGSAVLNMGAGTTLDLRNITFSRALALNNWTLAATDNSTSVQSGALTLSSNPGTVRVDTGSQLTISSVVSGTGRLEKTAGGLLILSNTNNYSGGTTFAGGALRVDNAAALGSGSLSFTGGTLRYGTGITTDFSNRIGSSTGAVSIDTNGQNITFATTLNSTNTGGLAKLGTGNLTLSVANTYTGNTTFAGGNLIVNNSGALSSGNLTFTGGTLRYGTGITTDYSQRIAGSTGAISVDTNGQNITFGNAISSTNTGGLNKLGNGTLTLSGANAYTGNTTVSAGTLTLGANNVLANSTSVTVAANATLQVGTTETFTSLSGNGTLRLTAGGNLTLTGNSSIGTLWITGNSTLNFGNNAFSVGTFIVDPGVSFQVNNQFVASNWWVSSTNQTNVAFNTRGTTPFTQVSITGLGGNTSLTFWQSGTNLVTVPEPQTYGATLMAGLVALFAWRRNRSRRDKPAAPSVTL